MEIQNRFRRYELKYLMTADEYEAFFRQAGAQVRPDAYGKTGILNLYYDTPDYRIIRRSLEKPVYKEKLRLRSYGVPGGEDRVFPELKKKYRSVVYKRREAMTLTQAEDFLAHPVPASQIMREIAYFLSRYEKIQPRMFLSYRREALYDSNDPGLRITFDTDIRWRTEDLDLRYGAEGTPLLPPDVYLMEVKTATALPLWLVNFLTETTHPADLLFQIRKSIHHPLCQQGIAGGILSSDKGSETLWISFLTVFSPRRNNRR